MKKWKHPSLFIVSADKLASIVTAAAISDCLRKHVR